MSVVAPATILRCKLRLDDRTKSAADGITSLEPWGPLLRRDTKPPVEFHAKWGIVGAMHRGILDSA